MSRFFPRYQRMACSVPLLKVAPPLTKPGSATEKAALYGPPSVPRSVMW